MRLILSRFIHASGRNNLDERVNKSIQKFSLIPKQNSSPAGKSRYRTLSFEYLIEISTQNLSLMGMPGKKVSWKYFILYAFLHVVAADKLFSVFVHNREPTLSLTGVQTPFDTKFGRVSWLKVWDDRRHGREG